MVIKESSPRRFVRRARTSKTKEKLTEKCGPDPGPHLLNGKQKMRFVFLSEEFYNDYPPTLFPEIEWKKKRPYILVVIDLSGVEWAFPLRSSIHHPNAFWTDKSHGCGVDYSKAIPIIKENYVDTITKPHIRQKEFNALRGKEYKIRKGFERYVRKYMKFSKEVLIKRDDLKEMFIAASTLQYFRDHLPSTNIDTNQISED